MGATYRHHYCLRLAVGDLKPVRFTAVIEHDGHNATGSIERDDGKTFLRKDVELQVCKQGGIRKCSLIDFCTRTLRSYRVLEFTIDTSEAELKKATCLTYRDLLGICDIISPMTYELMVLVAPAVDLTSEKAQNEIIEKLIGKKPTSVRSLGKKKLAYPIKKQMEATYIVATLEGTVKSADLDTKAKLMDDVLRVLLTVK